MSAMRSGLLAVVVLLSVLATPALAIELGDPAPPLKIAQWVKGEPVELAAGKGKNVYVIEFWATWCKPCRDGIPHLTALQKKYKDQGLVVIGVTDERNPKEVAPFVQKMGAQMDYTVAYDRDHQTNTAYMAAFGQQGIPHAFIVDKEGRLVWSGHPNFGLDEVVEQVINGKYDVKAARQAAQEEKKAMRAREEVVPLLQRYYELATAGNDAAAAEKLGREIVAKLAKDPQVLTMFAMDILSNKDFRHRDVALALQATKAAYDLASNRVEVIAAYARALWENGKQSEAVDYQKKAVAMVQGNPQMKELRAELEKALRGYEQQLKATP